MKIHNNILIKEINDDFIVNEVPCVPKGAGSSPTNKTYTILRVVKSGYTTFETIDYLSGKLDLKKSDINCCGLKDEDGVTEQLISIRRIVTKAYIQRFDILEKNGHYIKFDVHSYSQFPLTEKKLHGNNFLITLRSLSTQQADELTKSLLDNKHQVFLNYYDSQRFGLPGGPYLTQKIGEALVSDEKEKALVYYLESGNHKLDNIPKEAVTSDIFDSINPKKIDFFVSAYTSYLWNNSLSDLARKKSRNQRINIFPGYDLFVSDNLELPVEFTIDGFKFEDGQVKPYKKSRQTIVHTNVFLGNIGRDELNKGMNKVEIEFFLPLGCYATMAVKQLLATRLHT